MNINYTLADIIQTDFITGYRAYDVCHNKSEVLKIRAINDQMFDIKSHSNILYDEENVNGQKIPYIYGDINSFINFPNIIKYPKYTICAITKYYGNDENKKNNILTITNIANKITTIGHNNKWAGTVEYVNSSTSLLKISNVNYLNDWVVSCISYDSSVDNLTAGEAYFGSKNDPNGSINTKFTDIKAIIGDFNINTPNNINNLNSSWGLSHLLIWNTSLSSQKLRVVYSTFIDYLSNPAKNDIILYKNIYPRNLFPTCIENFYNYNGLSLNISKQLWAGYYAGNYNSQTNELPDFNGNPDRNIKSNMIKNVKLNNISGIPFLYGDKNSYIIFPDKSINSDFTICAITKYMPSNDNDNNMILQSIDNAENNLFYHGHYKNKKGVITYNNYEFSKGFPSNTSLNSWVVSCAKNTNSTNISENVIIDGQYSGLSINNDYINNKNKPISTLTINYNNTNNTSYYSNWALSYLLIWDSHLSDNELKTISVSLNNFIKKGETLSFMNLQNQVIYSAPSQSQYSSQYSNKCDNLSDIQKQMLQFNL
jgi:hypothetical protein